MRDSADGPCPDLPYSATLEQVLREWSGSFIKLLKCLRMLEIRFDRLDGDQKTTDTFNTDPGLYRLLSNYTPHQVAEALANADSNNTDAAVNDVHKRLSLEAEECAAREIGL